MPQIKREKIQFSILQRQDIDGVCSCLAKAFSQREPLAKHMQITVEDFYVLARYLCDKAERQQLSLVAKDTLTNQIVGCHIIESDTSTESEDITKRLSNKFLPIFALLEEVVKPLLTIQSSHKRVAHLFAVAVDEDYQNLGIAKKLLTLELNLLQQRGYEWCEGEFTNPYSLKAIQSVLVSAMMYSNEIAYKTFRYRDTFPFPIDGKVVACLYPTISLKIDEKSVKIMKHVILW
ncbi:MAG: hypothetical protein BWK79_19520 [Beggiatoa sp. IS2]|nr:MAG: hypothetical protein BWK79_19520 [Beggiatoa sp. IS2]